MVRSSAVLRSVGLTALLVVSVVAGTAAVTGTSAAAGNSAPDVRKVTQYQDATGEEVIEIAFSGGIDTASIDDTTTLRVTFEEGTTQTVYAGSSGYQNGFSARELTAERLVVATGGTDGPVANLTIDGVRGTDGTPLGRQTVDVRVASTTVDTRGTTQTVDAYRGANLSLVSATTVDSTFDVEGYGDTNVDVSRGTGPNSEVYVWDTDGLSLGTYNVSDGGDGVNVTLSTLDLTATLDDRRVEDTESIDGTVSAADIDRPVEVDLVDEDGDVVASQTVSIGSSGDADFAFDAVEPGNYSVDVEDRNTRLRTDAGSVTVVDPGTETAGFGDSTYAEARGDVVNVSVTFENTDTATVQFGDPEDDSYHVTAEVEDDDGDGRAVVEFNTLEAGEGGTSPGDVLRVSDGDDISDVRQGGSFTTTHPGTAGEDVLDAGEYTLEVTAGTVDGDTIGNPDDVATLSLSERTTGNVTLWRAPGDDFNSISDVESVREFMREGALVRASTVSERDVLVAAVSANGIEGAFDDSESYQAVSAEQRLFSFSIETASGEANAGPDRYNVGDIDSDHVEVVYDDTDGPGTDTHYVVIETDELGASFDDHESGDSYVANFTVYDGDGSDLGEETTVTSQPVDIEDEEVALDTNENGLVVVGAAANQTIPGETNLAPDTDLTLRLQSDGAADAFLVERPAVVRADGTFAATANFSGVSPGTNFTAQLRLDGDNVGERYDGYLVNGSALQSTETGTAGESPGPTATEPLTPSGAATPASDTDTAGAETAAGTTAGSGPGFTGVLALVAAIAAALLGLGHRD